ncbi:MAG TPA: hypothetical protein VHN11_16395, partial [Xanthobacteraceae bacterium]|nr:hypothetical protein [Xanthobacteraceae bacterium]
MVSILNILICALVALAYWTLLGFFVARRLVASSLAIPIAPLAGWAIHSASAVLVFQVTPFSASAVAAVAALTMLACGLATRADKSLSKAPSYPPVPVWAYLAAAALALVPAAALMPKHLGDAVALSAPIFDHAKVAMIDGIARLGMPPVNPFFGDESGAGRLVYYYLWHFSAAEIVLLLGVSGWEADIAMTWFAAFSSLSLMMGMAVRLCGRASAAIWAVVLAASGSVRPWLWWMFGSSLDRVLPSPAGFEGWLFQSAWVPQHIASAGCAVLALYLISQLVDSKSPLLIGTIGFLVAAGFESSTWIGGVAFAISSLALFPVLIALSSTGQRLQLISGLAFAALFAALLVMPFLIDQLTAATQRGDASPIVLHLYEVLGDAIPSNLRRILDVPAFWLILLPIQLPAVVVTGSITLAGLLLQSKLDHETRRAVWTIAVGASSCLAVSWLLVSTFGENDDLGWRAVLPAVMMLTIAAAAGLATWIASGARFAAACAIGAAALGWPAAASQIKGNFAGNLRSEGVAFAKEPELWTSVRRHADIHERVGNNPLAFKAMTSWPV